MLEFWLKSFKIAENAGKMPIFIYFQRVYPLKLVKNKQFFKN